MNYISKKASIGKNTNIGIGTIIEDNVVIGDEVNIGNYCIIKSGSTIGSSTTIMNFVEIRSGSLIGNNCYIDSRVSMSGDCIVGNHVKLRYGTIIARGCKIEDNCYLSPRVMTNNLDEGENPIGGAHIKQGTFIGTQAVIQHGITIGENSIIGAMAFVTKSFEGNCVLIGVPAKLKAAK